MISSWVTPPWITFNFALNFTIGPRPSKIWPIAVLVRRTVAQTLQSTASLDRLLGRVSGENWILMNVPRGRLSNGDSAVSSASIAALELFSLAQAHPYCIRALVSTPLDASLEWIVRSSVPYARKVSPTPL